MVIYSAPPRWRNLPPMILAPAIQGSVVRYTSPSAIQFKSNTRDSGSTIVLFWHRVLLDAAKLL